MKKTLVLFALLCMMSVSAFAVEAAKCVLQHNGSVKMYDASAIATAIADAVDGDVLYLTEGQFPGFTIDKKISVRGAGLSTKITGDISISIPGTPTLTAPILDGFYSTASIYLTTPMNGIKIRKCNFANFYINAANDDIVLDRCKIYNYFYQSSNIKGCNVNNCKINTVYYSGSSTNCYTFVNCNIYYLYNGNKNIKGTFINSIIFAEISSNIYNNCNFINTLHNYSWEMNSTSKQQECYYDTNFSLDNMECSYDSATLQSKGYLGNDGTVVGIYGGTNPYTLDLDIPKVTSSSISLDNANKKLNVSLKVTAK